MLRYLAGIAIYLLVALASVKIHDYSVDLYQTYFGEITAKDAVSGGAKHLAAYVLIVMNILMFSLPRLYAKLLAMAVMTALLLWILLPHYPIRALGYSCFNAGISVFALAARAGVDRLFFRYGTSASSNG